MGRSVGVVTLVISLVLSAVLFAAQWSGSGSPARAKAGADTPIQRANAAAALTTQMLAERELAAYQAVHGSFDGASLSGVSGVALRSAGATSYCLAITAGGSALYDAGPGGTLSSRPC